MRRWPLLLIPVLLACTAGMAQVRDGALRDRLRIHLEKRRASADVTQVASGARITRPGDYRVDLVIDGARRMYRLHVPAAYDGTRAMSLLVALHGGGGDMDLEADDARYGLVGASERHGFIAVFPNGTGALPNGRLATWNAGRCCGRARDAQVDDVAFIRRVVVDVSRALEVDASRVYATGMSNGGMMAYRLACDAGDAFRAVASVAGTDNTQRCSPPRPVAVLHIHARDDDHVLFEGGAGPNAFRNPATVTEFTSVPMTIAAWVQRDGCASAKRRVLDVPGATCDLAADCKGNARVQLCVTERGGHTWPGGHRARGAPSQALDANEVMWRFFDALPPRT